MKLSFADASSLIHALLALRRGDPRSFDDALWLAFGDRCGEVHRWLARVGAIHAAPAVMDVRITERGIRLIAELEAGRAARHPPSQPHSSTTDRAHADGSRAETGPERVNARLAG